MCIHSLMSYAYCSVWWWWWANTETHLTLPKRRAAFCRERGTVTRRDFLSWIAATKVEAKSDFICLFLVQTLDQLPLTNPEHFGTPVIAKKTNRGRRSSSLPVWVLSYAVTVQLLKHSTNGFSRVAKFVWVAFP